MNFIILPIIWLAYGSNGRRMQKLSEERANDQFDVLHTQQRSKLHAGQLLKTILGAKAKDKALASPAVESKPHAKRLLETILLGQAKSNPAVRHMRGRAAVRSPSAVTMAAPSGLPRLAIVGRPNTGKSTIFNRLNYWGNQEAVTHDLPGVTRDVNEGIGEAFGINYTLCDTGGLVLEDLEGEIFLKEIRETAVAEIKKADVLVMVTDGQEGVTALDEDIANFLRKAGKPVFLAVNKCESWTRGQTQAMEFYSLGLGDPWAVSGLHGSGIADLIEECKKHFPRREGIEEQETYEQEISVALLGRPNCGKSSLLNKLTGTTRSIVADYPGTTVDSIDQEVIRDNIKYTFIDTAGVRKKAKVAKGLEEKMVQRSFKAVRRADVAVLVVDAAEGANEQEVRLAQFIEESGTACVVVVNKWDLVPDKSDRLYLDSRRHLESKLFPVSWAKPVFASAVTGTNTGKIFEEVIAANEQYTRRIPTAVFNEVLEDIVRMQKPPSTRRGKQGSIYYGAQVSAKPPSLCIFCNDPKLFPDTYERYLVKQLRQSFGLAGSPVKLYWKGKGKRDVLRGA